MSNNYDEGRLNLPFVGICTFGKYPYVEDWNNLKADIAVMGAPLDSGSQYRSGARMGPRGIREASTLFSFGHSGAYDFEDDITYLPSNTTKIIDIGDADIIHTDTKRSHENIKFGVKKILEAKSIPIILGGDHSINIPCINAFEDEKPIHLIQIDAHMDFVDERHGVRYGHGNPIRRASEKNYVSGITQIGIRNVSSTAKEGYEDARKIGSKIFSVRHLRKMGIENILQEIPRNKRYYLTIDIDAFDPSIASGTGTPSHGGFYYYEVLELIDGIIKQGNVVGLDLVEVAPDYDLTNSTSTLAAQLLMNTIGRILYHKK
jgi:agmatinase|tara:strand:+ start:16 stop:969 length:954 start_codon:yes stop_codon:yes gene_type:complete